MTEFTKESLNPTTRYKVLEIKVTPESNVGHHWNVTVGVATTTVHGDEMSMMKIGGHMELDDAITLANSIKEKGYYEKSYPKSKTIKL